MLTLRYTSKFKKDFKVCIKRKYNLALLQQVIDTLRIPELLSPKYKEHMLSGKYKGYTECHILPDWLLIYQQTDHELLLYRTGSHSDLFKI